MILVDIYIPSVDKTYDFQLNENVKIRTVIEEIAEMVGQKERTTVAGNRDNLMLCDTKSQQELDKERTLREYSVTTGQSLLFI